MRSACTHYVLATAALAYAGLAACGVGSSDAASRPPVRVEPEEPDELPDGLTLRQLTHLGARYTVASLDLRRVNLDLYGQDPEHGSVQTIAGLRTWLRAQGQRLVLGTNSGIFETDGRPLGLHVERGRELRARNLGTGEGNFYLLPSGVFYVDGEAGAEAAHVVETTRFDADVTRLRLATQSGPALLLGGEVHASLVPNSESLKLRSGVGVAATEPSVVYVAISDDMVRFHDFATLFRDALACTDALYLDGTVSVLNAPGRRAEAHSVGTFGGILVVTEPLERPTEHPIAVAP